ncbi:MAG: hypothetical protein ACQEXQ_10840 [Bacillota bacterium]
MNKKTANFLVAVFLVVVAGILIVLVKQNSEKVTHCKQFNQK